MTVPLVPWSRLMCALIMMGCILALLGLLRSGASSTSASKAGPHKGQKSSKRAKKNRVLTQAGGGSTACICRALLSVCHTHLFYFIAIVGLFVVAFEASIVKYNPTEPAAKINARGRGTFPAALSMYIVPESWSPDAAGKAWRLVETGVIGAPPIWAW